MFTTKPKALTLTFFFYVVLALVLASGSEATEHQRRDHINLNRVIRKRSPVAPEGAIGVAPAPPGNTDSTSNATATSTATTTSAAVSSPTSASTTGPATIPPTSAVASTTAASTSASNVLSGILGGLTGSSSSNTSIATTSTSTSLSSSSVITKPSIPATISSAAPNSITAIPATPITAPLVTVTTNAASTTSAAASVTPTVTPSTGITKATVTVLAVIASCIGATAIIWTIIRKWKFSASSEFESRMRPIDWQPTTEEDSGLPVHRRAGSTASSFHSGSGHDGNGYGATSDQSHRSPSPLPPLPDHDFTAGNQSLAPVGGYADLARGGSPQPQMQEALTHAPSLTRPQYDQYGVPLHHQGGYATQDMYTNQASFGTHDIYGTQNDAYGAQHDAYSAHDAYTAQEGYAEYNQNGAHELPAPHPAHNAYEYN